LQFFALFLKWQQWWYWLWLALYKQETIARPQMAFKILLFLSCRPFLSLSLSRFAGLLIKFFFSKQLITFNTAHKRPARRNSNFFIHSFAEPVSRFFIPFSAFCC
jgi:hypothetical protein